MKLSVTGPFVQTLLANSEGNPEVPEQLATQLLSSVDKQAMAAYLLTKDAAVSLLAARLRENPSRTINDLQKMPGRQAPSAERVARKKKNSKASAKPRRVKTAGKRRRLSDAETQKVKQQVVAYLQKNGTAGRKELAAAASLNTQAIYRRIMTELQDEGTVVAHGEKSKTLYSLFSA